MWEKGLWTKGTWQCG